MRRGWGEHARPATCPPSKECVLFRRLLVFVALVALCVAVAVPLSLQTAGAAKRRDLDRRGLRRMERRRELGIEQSARERRRARVPRRGVEHRDDERPRRQLRLDRLPGHRVLDRGQRLLRRQRHHVGRNELRQRGGHVRHEPVVQRDRRHISEVRTRPSMSDGHTLTIANPGIESVQINGGLQGSGSVTMNSGQSASTLDFGGSSSFTGTISNNFGVHLAQRVATRSTASVNLTGGGTLLGTGTVGDVTVDGTGAQLIVGSLARTLLVSGAPDTSSTAASSSSRSTTTPARRCRAAANSR